MAAGFAREILPLFRPGDITCMASKGVRLGDARRVYAALSAGFMPPGQKWSQDQLDIFSTWMTEGFQP